MKFIRKELLSIPTEKLSKWPQAENAKSYNFAGACKICEHQGEKILIFTIYIKQKKPYMRCYICKDGTHINYFYDTGKWNKKRLSELYQNGEERERYGMYDTMDSYRGVISSEDSNKLCVEFLEETSTAPCSLCARVISRWQSGISFKKQDIKLKAEYERYKRAFSDVSEEPEDNVVSFFNSYKFENKIFYWNIRKKVISVCGTVERTNLNEYYCTACKSYFEDEFLDTFFDGDSQLKLRCPRCGAELPIVGTKKGTGFGQRTYYTDFTPCTPDSENAVATVWEFDRDVKFDRLDSSPYTGYTAIDRAVIIPVEQYVFTKYGSFGRSRYEFCGYKSYLNEEFREKTNIKNDRGFYFVTHFDEQLMSKTVLKNSHAYDYLRLCDRNHETKKSYYKPGTYVDLVKYCDVYLKYPGIENLLLNGFDVIVSEKIQGSKAAVMALKLKDKSKPSDILGLNRAEQNICKKEKWDCKRLYAYKLFRDAGYRASAEEIETLESIYFPRWTGSIKKKSFLKCCKNDVVKGVKYIKKQKAKMKNKSESDVITMWEDYIDMSAVIDEEIESLCRRYPSKLHEEHDRVLKKQKFLEDEKLAVKFKELKEVYEPMSYDDGKYCIRIAESQSELIVEGKILCHCVGTYADAHCKGRSIFFVRACDAPDLPLYTLNVDIKTGREIQLHGYKNEMDGAVIPQDVKDFVAYWLENIFVKYDIEKKSLMGKNKVSATGDKIAV